MTKQQLKIKMGLQYAFINGLEFDRRRLKLKEDRDNMDIVIANAKGEYRDMQTAYKELDHG